MITILSDTHKLQTAMSHNNPLYTQEDIASTTASLRYRLLICSPITDYASQSSLLSEASRLGVLVLLKPAICCQVSYRELFKKVKVCIQNINRNANMRHDAAELVLWLLFIGSTITVDSLNRAWSVAQICSAAMVLRLSSWDSVKSILLKFLWHEKSYERASSALWKDVLAYKYIKESAEGEVLTENRNLIRP